MHWAVKIPTWDSETLHVVKKIHSKMWIRIVGVILMLLRVPSVFSSNGISCVPKTPPKAGSNAMFFHRYPSHAFNN